MYTFEEDSKLTTMEYEEQSMPCKKPLSSNNSYQKASNDSVSKTLERWLEIHEPVDKDKTKEDPEADDRLDSISAYSRFKRMLPQDELDLHGLYAEEARQMIQTFIANSAARGLEKVSIIHGKGNHSQEEQVLIHIVREELEKNPQAGEFDFADSRHGGKGATWVRIRPPISRDK
jgi:DNA-nicking Smr family endonuclease